MILTCTTIEIARKARQEHLPKLCGYCGERVQYTVYCTRGHDPCPHDPKCIPSCSHIFRGYQCLYCGNKL